MGGRRTIEGAGIGTRSSSTPFNTIRGRPLRLEKALLGVCAVLPEQVDILSDELEDPPAELGPYRDIENDAVDPGDAGLIGSSRNRALSNPSLSAVSNSVRKSVTSELCSSFGRRGGNDRRFPRQGVGNEDTALLGLEEGSAKQEPSAAAFRSL